MAGQENFIWLEHIGWTSGFMTFSHKISSQVFWKDVYIPHSRYLSGFPQPLAPLNSIPGFLCPRIDRSGAYCFTMFVCLFICMSAESLTCELNIFHTIQDTMLIFGMQVAFNNTQLVRVISRSRSNNKVTILKKWPFRRQLCFTDTFCSEWSPKCKCFFLLFKVVFKPQYNQPTVIHWLRHVPHWQNLDTKYNSFYNPL